MMNTAQQKSRASSPQADHLTAQRKILAALRQEMPRVSTSHRYSLGLLAVAGLMLLLPVLYLGLILLIAHMVYWHLVHYVYLFQTGISLTMLLFFMGPPLIGLTVILFLIKPFFASAAAEASPQELNRETEPIFFEYVAAICDAIGAPHPTAIRLVCDVNASASFRQGLFSLFRRNDLVLTIGTPLVSGLSVRQLTGVLAHEFGHFSQHAGMRLSYIVRSLNLWFLRITFERDLWDETLSRWSRLLGWITRVIFLGAHICVGLSRVALFGLTWIATAVSQFFSREMEYSADRYEACLIDWKTIRATFSKLTDLSISQQMAIGDLQRFWMEERLPDDFAALVVSNIRHLTPEIRKQIRQARKQEKTGLFDTHPSDADRITAIKNSGLVGGFRWEGTPSDYPATVLFQDFGKISRITSSAYYRTVLGPAFNRKKLRSSADLIESREQEIASYDALDRFFQVRLPVLYPLPIDDEAQQKPRQPNETARKMKAARDGMIKLLPEYKQLIQRLDTAEERLFKLAAAQTLLECQLEFRPQDYGLASGKRKELLEKMDRIRTGIEHLGSRMLSYESEAGTRLSAAMQLLKLDVVVKRIPEGEQLREETEDLLPDALFLARLMADLLPMRIFYHRILVLGGMIRGNEARQRLISNIVETLSKLQHRLKEIRKSLADRFYPFDHADVGMTLQRYVIPVVPDELDLPGLIFVTQEVGERLMAMQVRMFARLALAAEKVESALGLPPLPQPKPIEKESVAPES